MINKERSALLSGSKKTSILITKEEFINKKSILYGNAKNTMIDESRKQLDTVLSLECHII